MKLDYISLLAKINGDFAEKLLSPLKTKSAAFYYAIKTPKWGSTKSQAWKVSITDLSNQIISNIPPGKVPVLGVLPFKDLRAGRFTAFTQILNEDIKTILARAQDLKVKEIKFNDNTSPAVIAQFNGLDYYVNGFYRMEKTGLEVRANLIETQTQNILSSANVIIELKALNPHDLELIDTISEEFKTAHKGKNSTRNILMKVVAAKPHGIYF